MPVPDFQTLMSPLLKAVADDHEHTIAEVVDRLAHEFDLSQDERNETLRSGQRRFYNRVAWAKLYLKRAGLLQNSGRGRFRISEVGHEFLGTNNGRITVLILEARFPALREFARRASRRLDKVDSARFDQVEKVWTQRDENAERIADHLQKAIPNDEVRRSVLELAAFIVESADEKRPDAWCARETHRGLILMAGRAVALEISMSKLRLGVMGPIRAETRDAVGADEADDRELKKVAGCLLVTLPFEKADAALQMLRDEIDDFIEAFVSRVRRPIDLSEHVPEAIQVISGSLGRQLPQPEPRERRSLEEKAAEATDEESEVSRTPRVRGRAPIFEHGQRSIASLLSDIDREIIALPDLQRPFVWEDTKVRDLLDSIFLGFPIGTLVLWHTSTGKEARNVGRGDVTQRATSLVIDGQQRLTSLYSVIKGVEVIDEEGNRRKIQIAFRPRDGRFEVADAAIRNDPEFVPNITEIWGGKSKRQIRLDLMNALRDRGRAVDDQYEDAVEQNLESAENITDYRLPTVDIRKTASSYDSEATEEDVAEIFVRINNQGTRLGQADFVLTLLSVFHGDLRDRIEERAQTMSKSSVVTIDTQQLLRAACAVAFERARMSAVYRSLRGVDATTGEPDAAGREARLAQLDEAADRCMDATTWRDYLLRVKHAGFVSPGLIPSRNAVVNAYAFYVRGKRTAVAKPMLDEVIARWLFATQLTARYSSASESAFEQDLSYVSSSAPEGGEKFVKALDKLMTENLTGDYWTRTLVVELETQKSRAPAALVFRVAQVVLGARALFSDQLLQNVLDPPAGGSRTASEAHHVFPVAWLARRGVVDRRQVNQVANLADVGWHENTSIGGRSPAEYVPRLREQLKISDERWARMCAEHALPLGWETMEYESFLVERRRRMAEIIRVAYGKLGDEAGAATVAPPWFLPGTEIVWQRIGEAELALRRVVRRVYEQQYGERAAAKVQEVLSDRDREQLERALRNRPVAADPLGIVDYLYLGQLPTLLFNNAVWTAARQNLSGSGDLKQKLQAAITELAPVRNEIAHVREVDQTRLRRAAVACDEILALVQNA